jgi:hypothetical protein
VAPATSLGARDKVTGKVLVRLTQWRWTPRLPSSTEQSSACLAASSSTRPSFTGVSKKSFGVTAVKVAASSKSNSSAFATVGSISWSPSPSLLRLSSIGGGRARSPSGNFGSLGASVSSCWANRLGDRSSARAVLMQFLVHGLIRGWLDAQRCPWASWRGFPPSGHPTRGYRRRDPPRRTTGRAAAHGRPDPR